jgi:hypothetical protein
MSIEEKKEACWSDKKEKLKLKFEVITSKYSMFEETEKSFMSGKLQARIA